VRFSITYLVHGADMSYGDLEDVGGSYGPTPTMSEGQCADKCVCNALDAGLSAITTALLQIDSTLEDLVGKNCQVVDKCKDEIIKLIDEHWTIPTKTCEECKVDLAQGLGGTLEFAVACAGACMEEIQQECSPGDESSWGKPCAGCNQEPCCCNEGVCEPCEQEQPKKKYIGYCNPIQGTYFVLPQGAPSPDEFANPVSYADTEEVALQEAQEFCQNPQQVTTPPTQPQPLQATNFIGTFCDIQTFYSEHSELLVTNLGSTSFGLAGIADSMAHIADVNFLGLRVGDVAGAVSAYGRAFLNAPPLAASLFLPSMAAALGCTDPGWVKSLEVIAAIGIVQKSTGVDLSDFTDSLKYVANSSCRRKFVEPDHAMSAYLANAMTDIQLDAHYAIAGLCNDAVKQRLETLRSKPSPEELVTMVHKGLISKDQYRVAMREAGFVRPQEIDDIYDNRFHSVEFAAVVRMAQNSTQDDSTSEKLGLDQGLDALDNEQFQKWIKANGVTQEETKQAWRSHWQNPSVGNLIEFLHRLRDNDDFGGEDKLLEELSDSLTTLGVTPYWHKHFLATAFVPLLKRDIRGAYSSGAISDDDIDKQLRTTGHTQEACDILAREYKQARRKELLSHIAIHNWTHQHIDGNACTTQLTDDGYSSEVAAQAMRDSEYNFSSSTWGDAFTKSLLTRDQFTTKLTDWGVTGEGANAIADKLSYRVTDHVATRGYIAGVTARSDASQQMSDDGVSFETIERLLTDADSAVRNNLTLECIRGVKHRFTMGELTDDETRNSLLDNDVSLERANQLVNSFSCERSAGGKSVSVEKLCHWLYIGAISQTDFIDRLLRLGYSEDNAAMLLFDCVQSNTLRAIKEAKALSKEMQSAADKQLRATNQANAAIERRNNQLAKQREAKAKLRANRDKQLLTSAERLSKSTGVDLVAAMAATRSAIHVGQEQYGLDVDETLKVIIIASEAMKGRELGDFQAVTIDLFESASQSGLEPSDADIGLPPSSNGSTQPS